MGTRIARVCMLLVLVAVPARALAQEETDCAEATLLRDKGKRAYEHADYAAALEFFETAYRKCEQGKWKFNIALALDGLGREIEALEMFEAALEEGKDADANTRAYGRKRLTELEAKYSTLILTSHTAEAEVRIDGKLRGQTPLPRPIRLKPGAYAILVTRDGRKPFAQNIDLAAGEKLTIDADLPLLDAALPTPAVATSQRSFLSRHRWSVIAGGSAVVLAGAGLGFGLAARSGYQDLTTTCADTMMGCSDSRISSVEQKALITNVLLGTAAAAAVTSAVFYFFLEKDSAPRDVAVVPTGAGATVIVRY